MGRATLEADMKALTAVILAAGESRRMRSSRPKALHPLGGRRLIDYPVRVARALGARVVLVVSRDGDDVRAAVGEAPDLAYVEQKDRLGTGHALLQARGACGDGAGAILLLPGDQPLMSEAMLRALVDHHRASGAGASGGEELPVGGKSGTEHKVLMSLRPAQGLDFFAGARIP